MNTQLALWLLPAGIAISLLLGAVLMVSRDHEARGGADKMMFVASAWMFGGLLEMAGTNASVVFGGFWMTHVSAALLPPLGLVTVCHFAGIRLNREWVLAVSLIPIVTVVTLTMPTLQWLMWTVDIGPSVNGLAVDRQLGPWFKTVHAPYSFGLYSISLAILAHHAFSLPADRRNYILAFITAALIPMIGCIVHLNGIWMGYESPTSLLIAVVIPLLAWLILRHGVLVSDMLEHRILFEQMRDGVIVLGPADEVLAINAAGAKLLGREEKQMTGLPLEVVLPEIKAHMQDITVSRPITPVQVGKRELSFRLSRVRRQYSDQMVTLLICQDVTNERLAQRRLERNEELLRSLIHHSSNAILRIRKCEGQEDQDTPDFTIMVANPVAAALFHTTATHLIGRKVTPLLFGRTVSHQQRSLQSILPTLQEATETGLSQSLEFNLRTSAGMKWYRMIADPVGNDIGITCVDITNEREQKDALQSAAFHDPLTGVLNRRGFEQAASLCLANLNDEALGALLFVDLNSFKRINDLHGHETGDAVLKKVAARLKSALRDVDIVARHGGDEFVILVPDTQPGAADGLRERLVRELAVPYPINTMSMHCSASVGMALLPDQGVTLTSLLRAADASMYTEKAKCRGVISGTYNVLRVADSKE